MHLYIYIRSFGKDNVTGSLLSQHPMGIPNIVGVQGALYGIWGCDPPSEVQGQIPKSYNYIKIFKA